jgi:glycosyltransferase involved in cell wall biosynthesis
LRVAQNLQKLGHDVTIFGRFTQGRHQMEDFFSVSEKNQNLECDGVNVRVLVLDSKARLMLKPVFKLIWRKSIFPLARWLYVAAMREQIAASSRGADVVHFFGNGPEMLGFAAEAAARQVGAKFVVEPALHEGQWGDKWFDALLYKRADLLLAHTRYEAGVLERMGMPATKIRTIVHGVDFCDSGDGERFREKYGITGPMVLFLGRKTLEKGVGRLLEAWPMVAEKFPDSTLVLAGPKSTALRPMADGGWRMVEEKGLTTIERQGRRENEQPKVGPKGEGVGTTESKNTEGSAGLGLASQDGAAFSNPFTSELARDSENASLTRSASGPAGARIAPEDGRSEIVEKEFGSDGGNHLEDSREFLEGQSQAGLQMDSQKLQSIRAANDTSASGQNSSFVLIREIRGSNFAALDAGRSTLDTAPKALNLDDLAEGEKQDALAACDLLCVPSEGESFGMVYFEAWAYKKPVVALDLPALRETVGAAHAGILVENGSREVAAGIIALLENPEVRNEMGMRGKELAQQHSWEAAAKSYELAYRENGMGSARR